ncbi:hypothetical protein [Caballeronia calidae]|uniref:hypothetical protein n=1 Tax=Caballeronia calidae TaxID=1777139 RepID=UPI000788A95F|nr:hypothetical protein [Caballeronia calidae]
MSTLFAQLVDAAIGRVEVLRPPPRPRFAVEHGFEPQDGSPQPEAQGIGGSARKARQVAPDAPVRRVSPAVRTLAKEPSPQSRTRTNGPTLLPPKAPREERREAVAAWRAPTPTADDFAPRAHAARRLIVEATSSAPTRPAVDDDRTLRDPSFAVRPDEHEVFRRAPAVSEPLRRDTVAARLPAVLPPEIRIGRIEVSPPATTAVSNAVPRAPRPGRAPPRQSLDDYLRARRR